MRVAVLGAGVAGVTSAWYLARAGHEVTVYDRQPGPGLETSFANAGELSFGYCSPWAAPGVPLKALRWLMTEHAPLILRPKADPAMAGWLVRMLHNCSPRRYALNKGRMLRLAEYSRAMLADLRTETGIAYDQRMQGTLQLFRSPSQVEAAGEDVRALARDGIPFEVLDREGCIRQEPALRHVADRIAGGLLTPLDETGDCFLFTEVLAGRAAALGVRFIFGRAIRALAVEGGRVSGVVTDRAVDAADAVVVALGSHSSALLRPLGIRLPVYPVKGYSLTFPITDETRAPRSTVMDETFKVAITRLGDRVRVGGLAEISGYSTELLPARRRTLEKSVRELFPAGDVSRASFWTGLRPMTPDGTPLIGATRFANLFLNTGHGTLGWTMSCGSARVVADLVSGRPPEIEAGDLGLARYGGRGLFRKTRPKVPAEG